jgi:lipopolysaccharide export system protein LptC
MKPQTIANWTQHEMELLVRSVARYTRFVRSTKVILSILVLSLTAIVLFYSLSNNDVAGVRIAFTSVEKGPAAPTQMINAQFHGLDKENQPFNVTAKTATQQNENTLLLDKVAGDISLKTGVWLSVTANSGIFTVKDRLLDLKGAIDMFNDEGYEFRTEVLHVNVGQKTAVTHAHVEGQGALGTLKAEGADFDGKTGVIIFHGPVFVTVHPPQDEKTEGKK